MRLFTVFGLLVVAALGWAEARAAEIHVAPGGADTNPGTVAAPLQSFAAAQQAARRLAGREPVTVLFADGVYRLPATVRIEAADSGTAAAPVVYAAAPGARPVLSGGVRLELKWEAFRDGILKAALPDRAMPQADQLFVNGVRLPMARYPNFDATIHPYNGFAADAFSPERAARWADPAGGFIHAMHRAHWGGYHYRITGKDAKGAVTYEGGWQNNRQMGMHPQHRFVENVFEELDAPGEWYHDAKTGTLYLCPPAGTAMATSVVEAVRLRHLVEFAGTRERPVRFVALRGFVLRHTARTFMDVKEPLLRSDWTIYRGGAVRFEGAEDCAVQDCEFDQPGGNGVFVSGYNRRIAVRGCHLHDCGASAVAFVGDPKSVRSPLFEYAQRNDYAAIDRTPGPKTEDYPADCTVEECLIRRVGVVEKQATGVEISMALGVTIRHCTICEASRAGINVSEGTFGGHVIEFCDVFDTVRETGDHGSFNSWGRDRYWGLKDAPPGELPALARLDVVRPNVIRNSRWRCDHGWDVDLDDGSTDYEIYNNLFLHGGLKLREGFHRRVWNNIAVNNGLHPHVWYANCGDVVTNNIWMAAYRPAGGMPQGAWGREIDRNLFTSEADRVKFAAHGCDAHSAAGDPMFVDPEHGDFRVKDGSPALKLGFVNFPMDRFGVQKPDLKALAGAPTIDPPGAAPESGAKAPGAAPSAGPALACWLGARVRGIEGEEFSAFGVSRESGGVQMVSVPGGSIAARCGFRADDLVQGLDGRPVRTVAELLRARDAAAGMVSTAAVIRAQQPTAVAVAGGEFVTAESAGEAAFTRVRPVERPVAIRALTTRPKTQNEPVAALTDGRLEANYGPVFANNVAAGLYKADLGGAVPVASVGTWSHQMGGKRGAQRFVLYGSVAEADPGWNVGDVRAFTPLAAVDCACADRFLGTRVEAGGGGTLGTWRWLVWAVAPVTGLGENTAFQEFQVVAAPAR